MGKPETGETLTEEDLKDMGQGRSRIKLGLNRVADPNERSNIVGNLIVVKNICINRHLCFSK